ncbi:MAG: cell division protein ZapE [Pseudomonadota bacterium]
MTTYEARVASGRLREDPAQKLALAEFARVQEALETPVKTSFFRKAPPPPKGLYLWGGVGRGKSMLMDLFVEVLDAPVRRVHFHAFMQEIQAKLHEVRKTGVEDAVKPVAAEIVSQVRCLAFDEMQITDITDAMIVGRLFKLLFEGGVVVVTTSNRVPQDLYKDGLNRALFLPFIDLLQEKMIVHELAADTDYRQDRLSGEPVYFSPLSSETRDAVSELFNDLAGDQVAPLTFEVKSRQMTLPAFGNGVGRATFFDLCGTALGPADYLALTEHVKMLVLEEIPRLGRSNFNEAKRFVTLIDTLYEARTGLIVSAAASPEMLYMEGEGSFEFERTASRLREMQSADWMQQD